MAIAAAIPAPRVVIVDGGANAAAFGRDDTHATVLIGFMLVLVGVLMCVAVVLLFHALLR